MLPISCEHSWWSLWIPCPQGQWNKFLVIFWQYRVVVFHVTTFASPSAWHFFPNSSRVLAWMLAAFLSVSSRTTYIRSEVFLLMQRQHLKRPVFAMWNMQEFGIQNEWTITTTRTPLTTRSTRSTRSTTRNPTMCAATWNTWGTRENARSVTVFVVSLCFAVVTLFSCTSHIGSRCLRLRLIPSHGHHHVACMSWAFSVTSLTFSSTSLSSSSIFQHFLLPFNFPEVK